MTTRRYLIVLTALIGTPLLAAAVLAVCPPAAAVLVCLTVVAAGIAGTYTGVRLIAAPPPNARGKIVSSQLDQIREVEAGLLANLRQNGRRQPAPTIPRTATEVSVQAAALAAQYKATWPTCPQPLPPSKSGLKPTTPARMSMACANSPTTSARLARRFLPGSWVRALRLLRHRIAALSSSQAQAGCYSTHSDTRPTSSCNHPAAPDTAGQSGKASA